MRGRRLWKGVDEICPKPPFSLGVLSLSHPPITITPPIIITPHTHPYHYHTLLSLEHTPITYHTPLRHVLEKIGSENRRRGCVICIRYLGALVAVVPGTKSISSPAATIRDATLTILFSTANIIIP